MHWKIFQTFPPEITIIGQNKSGDPYGRSSSVCIQDRSRILDNLGELAASVNRLMTSAKKIK